MNVTPTMGAVPYTPVTNGRTLWRLPSSAVPYSRRGPRRRIPPNTLTKTSAPGSLACRSFDFRDHRKAALAQACRVSANIRRQDLLRVALTVQLGLLAPLAASRGVPSNLGCLMWTNILDQNSQSKRWTTLGWTTSERLCNTLGELLSG